MQDSLKTAREELPRLRAEIHQLQAGRSELALRAAEVPSLKEEILELRKKLNGSSETIDDLKSCSIHCDGSTVTVNLNAGTRIFSVPLKSPGFLGDLAIIAKNLKVCHERLFEAIMADRFDQWESKYWKTYEKNRIAIEAFFEKGGRAVVLA
jgi:hypothetical protein